MKIGINVDKKPRRWKSKMINCSIGSTTQNWKNLLLTTLAMTLDVKFPRYLRMYWWTIPVGYDAWVTGCNILVDSTQGTWPCCLTCPCMIDDFSNLGGSVIRSAICVDRTCVRPLMGNELYSTVKNAEMGLWNLSFYMWFGQLVITAATARFF